MHPILSDRRRLAGYMAAWLPVGLLLSAPLARIPGGSWREAFLVVFPVTALYAFASLAAWYPCRAFPLRSARPPRLLLVHATAATLTSLLCAAAGYRWSIVVSGFDGMDFAASHYDQEAALVFASGCLLFLLSASVHYLFISYEEQRQAERRGLEMSVLAREAELNSLRAQIDPHFLFNCLNIVAALAPTDPARARQMCVLLADFLRQTLQVGSRASIPLDEEVKLATDYLAIEQIRFGGRLRAEAWIDRSAGQCKIPPLLLQPLVENAVKHGVAHQLEGGLVRIEARLEAGSLAVSLHNTCDPDRPRSPGLGLGLQNVRRRIEVAYGNEARLDVRDDAAAFEAVLRLPIRNQS